MIYDPTLNAECPWVIKIASAKKLLTRQEEYDLISVAGPSVRAQVLLHDSDNQAMLARCPKRKEVLQRISKRGLKQQTILLEHNYRLIISIAKKYYGRGLSWEDMIQHGSEGFIYAVSKFNLKTGNKLSTYASQWIRQRIGRAIENTGRAIRIPGHMQSKINGIKHIYRKFLERDEGAPSSEDLTHLFNLKYAGKKNFKPITSKEVEELGRYLQDITSLNEAAGDDENLSILDYIRDAAPGPDGDVELLMDKEELGRLIGNLEVSDRAFIKFKYGLVDDCAKSDAKTAQAFCMTIKAVREREQKILNELVLVADFKRTNLATEVENFSVVAISSGGGFNTPEASVLARRPITNFPAKIRESTDKDQMLILKARIESMGGRAEIISSL